VRHRDRHRRSRRSPFRIDGSRAPPCGWHRLFIHVGEPLFNRGRERLIKRVSPTVSIRWCTMAQMNLPPFEGVPHSGNPRGTRRRKKACALRCERFDPYGRIGPRQTANRLSALNQLCRNQTSTFFNWSGRRIPIRTAQYSAGTRRYRSSPRPWVRCSASNPRSPPSTTGTRQYSTTPFRFTGFLPTSTAFNWIG